MSGKWLFALALLAAGAQAQQSVDISGDDFNAGKGDAQLAALAQKASGEGKRLVITAPKEWHPAIASKLGKYGDVVLREGFYESVLARTEDKPQPPKPAVAAAPPAEPAHREPEAAPRVVEAAPVVAPKPAPVAVAPAAAVVPPPAPAPATVAAPAPAPVAAAPKPAAQPLVALPAAPAARPQPAAPDEEAIRERLRQSLIEGRAAQGDLAVGSLLPGDVVYVDGPVRGVVRREGTRASLYWLDGELDLRRSELKPLTTDRYQVLGSIIGEGSLRPEFDTSAAELAARVPAEGGAERAKLEQAWNAGRGIRDTLSPGRLLAGDVIYVSGDAAVVARREGRTSSRFWLDGTLDLRQAAIRADGDGKYRVIGNVTR